MSKPLVTVIISCYNHEAFIEEAIESVLNQSYKNVQLLVYDDCSPDNSHEILLKIQAKYGFFYHHYEKNQGFTKVLNQALRNDATGKYICLLGSDDWFELSKLAKQVDFMEAYTDHGMVYSRFIKYTQERQESEELKRKYKEGMIYEDLLYANFIPASSVMIRRTVLDELGLFDEELYYEDLDMWLRIAKKYPIGFLDEPLSYYRKHDLNCSNNLHKMFDSKIKILQKHKDYPKYRKIRNKCYEQAFYRFSDVDKKEAWKYARLGWQNCLKTKYIKALWQTLFKKTKT